MPAEQGTCSSPDGSPVRVHVKVGNPAADRIVAFPGLESIPRALQRDARSIPEEPPSSSPLLSLPPQAKTTKFEEVMERLRSYFSPEQIAKLLLWVSANRSRLSKLPLLPSPLLKAAAGRVAAQQDRGHPGASKEAA